MRKSLAKLSRLMEGIMRMVLNGGYVEIRGLITNGFGNTPWYLPTTLAACLLMPNVLMMMILVTDFKAE